MDIKPRSPQPNQSKQDLEFVVMPHMEQAQPVAVSRNPPSSGEAILPPARSGRKKNLLLAAGGLVLVLILGLVGYWVFGRGQDGKPPADKAINISVPDQKAPENTDTDQDGLTDAKEEEIGTNAQRPDSDGDGLADSDEVNVYGSDPLLSDTDRDTYADGREVAGGFSPIVNTLDKASTEEQQQWADRIIQFGLHEPTLTTLKSRGSSAAPSTSTSDKIVYTSQIYKYSIELPNLLSIREKDSGASVGIYITGTTPDDEDVTTDPIFLSIAVNVEKSPVTDWITTQYQPGDYEKSEDVLAGSLKGVRLRNVQNEVCSQDKTFYSQNGQVVIITWTCNKIITLGPLYDEVIKSFKFQ